MRWNEAAPEVPSLRLQCSASELLGPPASNAQCDTHVPQPGAHSVPAAAPAPHGRAGRRLRTSRQAARHLLPGGKRLSPLANTSGQCVRSPGRPPRKRPPPPQGCAAPARRQLHTQRPAAAAVAFNAPPRLAPAVTARSFPKPRVHPPPGRGEGRGGERREPRGKGGASSPGQRREQPGWASHQAAPICSSGGSRERGEKAATKAEPAPGTGPGGKA